MKTIISRAMTGVVLFLTLGFLLGQGRDALAQTITDTLNFSENDLILSEYQSGGQVYTVVILPGGSHIIAKSKPYLPVKNLKYVIPPSQKFDSLKVVAVDSVEVSGGPYSIYPSQPPEPTLIGSIPTAFTTGDSSIYESSHLWPGYRVSLTKQDYSLGFKIITLSVFPVQYLPSEGSLYLYTHMEYEIYCSSSPGGNWAQQASRTQEDQNEYLEIVKQSVENPNQVEEFAPNPQIISYDKAWSYIIITPDSLKVALQPLSDWYNRRGIRAYVQDLDSIYQNYSGANNEEKIRNFIKDRYANEGARYILLGGDGALIPPTPWLNGWTANCIPTDLYYSCLDWTWDPNGNGDYADPDPFFVQTPDGDTLIEQGAIDYGPDIFVGRAPVSNSQEAALFVQKTLSYQENPSPNYHQGEKGLLLGAMLFCWCSGGVDKDSSIADLPGYSTNYYRLYDDAYDTLSPTWYLKNARINRQGSVDQLNESYYLVNHGGHGNYSRISVSPSEDPANEVLTPTDLDSLSNEGYSPIFSFACLSAPLDKGADSCFARHWLSNDEGGGIAYVGHSRLGFNAVPISTEALSPLLDRLFWRSLYRQNKVGQALAEAKFDYPLDPYFPDSTDTISSCASFQYGEFASLNLLGDPALPVWMSFPETLHVSHPDSGPTAECSFSVQVISDGSPVSDAWVCLYKEGDIYTKLLTDGSGEADFTVFPQSSGSLYVTVTKYSEYIPYRGKAAVSPCSSCVSTHIGGTKDWEGEILICGDVTVDSGAVLTIKPGAVVRSVPDRDNEKSGVDTTKCELIVYGTLNIAGTDTEEVTITSTGAEPKAGDWYGIRIMNGGKADIQHANIKYGYCGLKLHSGSVDTVKNCHITQNEVYGIRCETDDAYIYNNTIDYNERYGIYVHNHSPNIVENTVANYPQSTPSYDIYCYFQTQTSSKIQSDTLKGNPHGVGLYLYRSRPLVEDCTIKDDSIGVVVFDSDPVITENTLSANQIGLSCDCLADPTFKKSTIENSTRYGVYCTGGSYPVIGGSGINCCSITGSAYFHVYNDNQPRPNPIMAERNWWGTRPPDPNKFAGPVDYNPYSFFNCRPSFPKVALPENLPQEFSLSQNYPNPFNPTTVIKYALPTKQHVVLRIYNLLGQVVTTLVDDHQRAGYYQVRWNGKNSRGKNIASGVYFYRIKAGSFVRTRKLLLLK